MKFEQAPNYEEMNPAKFLIKVAGVNTEDIAAFKAKLGDDEQYMFEVANLEEKQILVALDNLSDDELDQLMAIKKRLIGVHDLSNYLGAIYALTQNPRYQKK